VQPADTVGARLPAGNVKGSSGRIDSDYLQTAGGEQAREGSCATADVQDGHSAELAGQSRVGIQIGTVGVQRVVDLREPGFPEDRISHGKNPMAGDMRVAPAQRGTKVTNNRPTI
jgi:hypothetical protein